MHRTDYHFNETEEWFFQQKGPMLLKIVDDDGVFKDIEIGEGCMFMLPPNTPHNPCRFADTIGLVVERKRPKDSIDRLRWYCRSGKHATPTIIHEEAFHCEDLGTRTFVVCIARILCWITMVLSRAQAFDPALAKRREPQSLQRLRLGCSSKVKNYIIFTVDAVCDGLSHSLVVGFCICPQFLLFTFASDLKCLTFACGVAFFVYILEESPLFPLTVLI